MAMGTCCFEGGRSRCFGAFSVSCCVGFLSWVFVCYALFYEIARGVQKVNADTGDVSAIMLLVSGAIRVVVSVVSLVATKITSKNMALIAFASNMTLFLTSVSTQIYGWISNPLTFFPVFLMACLYFVWGHYLELQLSQYYIFKVR
eukprot:GHVU01031640.1.p1 GENE.GHVU01031640.1~~GHVU01031640.1.p1  ORF type:complete len:146 (-),score=4.34 GHVU01031640.1:1007-1444(-)